MTNINLNPRSSREQERQATRRDKFFDQTTQENNDRLNAKPQNFDTLMQEIKFIESILLAKFGNEEQTPP